MVNKIQIFSPSGNLYITLFVEEQMLKIKIAKYPDTCILLDKRIIPELIKGLSELQELINLREKQ